MSTIYYDSIAFQLIGDSLEVATKVSRLLNGKLQVIKNLPLYPSREDIKIYKALFKRNFPKSAIFIALVYHQLGQVISLTMYGNSKGVEIAFHGLQQHQKDRMELDDGAIQRKAILIEFLEKWDDEVLIKRFDICQDFSIDWKHYSNTSIHRILKKKHTKVEKIKRTTLYYQPKKYRYVKITAYCKVTKNGLQYPLIRVEYSFLGQFWKNLKAIKTSIALYVAIENSQKFIKKLY